MKNIILILALFAVTGLFAREQGIWLDEIDGYADLELYDPEQVEYVILLDDEDRPVAVELAAGVGEAAKDRLGSIAMPMRNLFFGG